MSGPVICLSSVLLNLTLSAILSTGASSLVMFFVGGACRGGKSGEHGAVRGSGELVLPLVCENETICKRSINEGLFKKNLHFIIFMHFIIFLLNYTICLVNSLFFCYKDSLLKYIYQNIGNIISLLSDLHERDENLEERCSL